MPKIPEFSLGSQMERSVSVYSDRNIRNQHWRWSTSTDWTEICHSTLATPLLFGIFHLRREFREGMMNGKGHSSWLAWLVSDRSIWHNGKHLRFQSDLQEYYCQLALTSIEKIGTITKLQRSFRSLHVFIPLGTHHAYWTLDRPRALACYRKYQSLGHLQIPGISKPCHKAQLKVIQSIDLLLYRYSVIILVQ